jgi:hypothetical protein
VSWYSDVEISVTVVDVEMDRLRAVGGRREENRGG